MEILIDGSYIKTNDDVHWMLKKALHLPDTYGMSTAALRELLAGWEQYPLWIRWMNVDEGKLYPEELDRWKSFFADAKKSLPDLHVIYRNRNHIYSSITELVGETIDTVAFVQDYVELHSGGGVIRIFTDPFFRTGLTSLRFPERGSRDSLCELIGQHIVAVDLDESSRLELTMEEGSVVTAPMGPKNDRALETVHFFSNDPRGMMIWY